MGTLEDTRGSQRQLLVKYLFGEANIAYNFLQKFLAVLARNMTVPFMYNFRRLILINFLRFFEVLFLIFYTPLFGHLKEA